MGVVFGSWLAFFAFGIADGVYSICARLTIKAFQTVCGGVPVITFFDASDYDYTDESSPSPVVSDLDMEKHKRMDRYDSYERICEAVRVMEGSSREAQE